MGDLGICEQGCGFNGVATQYSTLCDCIIGCLRTCAETNEQYFACAVAPCSGSGCP
jgi:hypothetical protein